MKKTEADSKMRQLKYTASDVKKMAGLSYRQINNWNSKGALPGERDGKEGWNKFSARDMFALMVCSKIRMQFHVPLESIKWIQSFMQQKGADHLKAAIGLNTEYFGCTVWLLTDCKTTFIMEPDFEFEDMFNRGFFRDDGPEGYIFLKINPIVNRLWSILNIPIKLETHDAFYNARRENQKARSIKNSQELEVLKLVRSGVYDCLTIKLKNGKILSAEGEEEISGSDQKRFLQIIEQHKYQTVTIKKQDGKIVRLNRKIPIKFSDDNSLPISLPTEKP